MIIIRSGSRRWFCFSQKCYKVFTDIRKACALISCASSSPQGDRPLFKPTGEWSSRRLSLILPTFAVALKPVLNIDTIKHKWDIVSSAVFPEISNGVKTQLLNKR